MKHLIIALSLFAATPAFATVNRTPPRAVLPTIYAIHKAYDNCYRADPKSFSKEQFKKECDTFDTLREKLRAQGYCVIGHVGVGIASKDRKHCYQLHYSVPR